MFGSRSSIRNVLLFSLLSLTLVFSFSNQFSEAATSPILTSLIVGTPTGKTANIGTDPIKISLSWTDTGSKWKVFETGNPTAVATVTSKSVTLQPLEKGVAHCYTIQRINPTTGANIDPPSNVMCSHVQPVISVAQTATDKVKITWTQAPATNPAGTPTGYKVERVFPSGTLTEVCSSGSSICASATFTSVLSSGTLTHTDTVAAGKKVCYEIQGSWSSPRINMDSDKACLTMDNTPPVISLLINDVSQVPTSVSNTWYNQNVNLKWIVTDPESGVSSSTGCEEQNVTSDTDGITFSCTATNGIGLIAIPVYVTIKRDTVNPDIVLVDSADGNADNIITVQADQIAGRTVDYVTTVTDDRSGVATGPICTPASGTLFAIADTLLPCTASDNAGNSVTETYTIRVLPFIFIALGTTDHPIYQNDLTDVIVADPAATGTATVVLSSDGPPEFGTANAILSETSPGIFEGKVVFSEQVSTDSSGTLPANLYAGLGTLVKATYDSADSRGTSTTPYQEVRNKTPPGEGGAAYIASLPALSWNSDAAHIETGDGITAKRSAGQAGCTSATTIETINVNVTSTSYPQGIIRSLNETSVSSCVLSTTANIKFTTASTNTSVPQIKTAPGELVKAKDGLGNVAQILVLSAPTSAPTSGIAVPTTSTDCGVGGDTDSDGICNSWEDGSNPLTIGDYGYYVYSNDGFSCPRLIDDPNGDTVANPVLVSNTANPATCPSPNVKDLFYEIDYMPNHKPNYLALLDVINTFKSAPNPSANCPTCPGPINMHFKINEQLSVHDNYIPWSIAAGGANPLGGFDQIKSLYYGSPADRTDPNVLLSERQVMRYILFSHAQEEAANQKSSGYAEVYGNDIEISMGPFSGGTGTRMEQAATVLHEIGHNIGLGHGGSAANLQNCKPNHLSVMNYAFQFTNYVPSRILDFSRVKQLDLNENSLNETSGISPTGAAYGTVYGPFNAAGGTKLVTLNASVVTPIDWNRDGDTADTIAQNINLFGFLGCNNDDSYPAATTLTGSNDWAYLNLLFRTTSSTFADGIQALNPIDPSQNIGSGEPTFEIFQVGSGVAPIINDGGPYSVNEGDTVTLDASASTDSDGVVEIYRWNFDDLTQWDTPGVDVLGSQAIIFADDDANSPFTALLGIWDDSANGVSQSVDVTVANVNPTIVSSGSLVAINEGDTLTIDDLNAFTFTDPGIIDTHTASIDWGDTSSSDGTVVETLGTAPVIDPPTDRVDTSGTVTSTHTYVDDDSDDIYAINVTVTDKDGGIGTSSRDVTVLNVSPTVTSSANSLSLNEGDTLTGSGSFTDPGADTWTATVDYGDGSGVQPLLLSDKTFVLSHLYADNPLSPATTYTVTISVTDDDSGVGIAIFDVTVLNVAPAVTLNFGDATINAGQSTPFGSGSFTDPGADTWSASVNYGDGTTLALTLNPDKTFTVPAHTYATSVGSPFTVTVTVTDDDLGIGTKTSTITVNAVVTYHVTFTKIHSGDTISKSKNPKHLDIEFQVLDANNNIVTPTAATVGLQYTITITPTSPSGATIPGTSTAFIKPDGITIDYHQLKSILTAGTTYTFNVLRDGINIGQLQNIRIIT